MLAIEARGLSRAYGATEAVRDVSLEVRSGEIFGFLGPNGAGKTTTIRMLTTLLPPTAGEARVLGYDVRTEGAKLRPRIGVVQQGESYEYTATVEDALALYAILWGVPKHERKGRIDELLRGFDLEAYRTKRVQALSVGLRRRLQVAREFLHEMDLLFLDEPTVGLDPIARRGILEAVREKARGGLTVFLTTQNLDEAETLCDRIAILQEGRVVTVDTPQALKDRFGGMKTLEVAVEAGDSEAFLTRLRAAPAISSVASGAAGVRVWTRDPGEALKAVLQLGEELGLRLGNVTVHEPTLEQAFINLVERKEGRRP